MGSPLTWAAAFLTGFAAEYLAGDDHQLGQFHAQASVPPCRIHGSAVTVQISYALRDWSGNWDDLQNSNVFVARSPIERRSDGPVEWGP
ncbi:MAG: hypothetical protein ABI178_10405 [Rhodanobacter sp.]